MLTVGTTYNARMSSLRFTYMLRTCTTGEMFLEDILEILKSLLENFLEILKNCVPLLLVLTNVAYNE